MIEKIHIRPEGGMCEHFTYLPNLIVYQNSSYMKELSEIVAEEIMTEKNWFGVARKKEGDSNGD